MNWHANWICSKEDFGDVAPLFARKFHVEKEVSGAILTMTALGTYEAKINGHRVSSYVLAPGWTSYWHRLQYQEYDVTPLLQRNNLITVNVGKGWYRSPLNGDERLQEFMEKPSGLIAQLKLHYTDGTFECIVTDENWKVSESQVRFSEIYDGEIYDSTFVPRFDKPVEIFEGPTSTLILQEGEEIQEHEVIYAAKIITTPKGECIVDFGQEITGYVEFQVEAKAGDIVKFSHGEVLDKNGNFYNENYRTAKAECTYICRDGKQKYHSILTFYGFRYIRLDSFPGGIEQAKAEQFKGIAVYSNMKRTGYVSCSHPKLNQLFDNIIWGQKDNFLDLPTDCPQRDERLGWTGDAQMFSKAAALNYDVEKFFKKWLGDVAAEQEEDGYVPYMVPGTYHWEDVSCAWGDVATICPWEIYMAYGNPEILARQFACMKKYISYIRTQTTHPYLWQGGRHYGDWLALDAEVGSYKGISDPDLLASAFFAYSTSLVVKAGNVLGEDVSEYEKLYCKIVQAFQETYDKYKSQTECAVAIHFRLAKDCKKTADQLAEMVRACGMHLETGFVGTPYLLHALSDFGHADLAYTLLMREEYPSWLYSVNNGATTMWEHWDSKNEVGEFWSAEMNSFNHYAYGSVIDWVYTKAAGIQNARGYAGYEKVRIEPMPDERLDWLSVSLETRRGTICSRWKKQEGYWRYDITTPVETEIVISGQVHLVQGGSYCFFEERENA